MKKDTVCPKKQESNERILDGDGKLGPNIIINITPDLLPRHQ